MNTDDLPRDRATAKATGAAYYFTGKPCKHGHVAPRKTKGVCVECMKHDWSVDNEKRKGRPKSEASKAAGRRYYAKNREAVIARSNMRPKEEKRRNKAAYKARNKERYCIHTNTRRRRHKKATPPWVGEVERKQIREMYLMAQAMTKTTGERYVVDHIVPLQGEHVCGLHAPNNLRVITQEKNLEKSNHH